MAFIVFHLSLFRTLSSSLDFEVLGLYDDVMALLSLISTLRGAVQKEKYSRFLQNIGSLFLLQVFQYLIPLITLPYLVRVLGEFHYGMVMFSQSFVLYFLVLVDFGFDLSATKAISVNRDSPGMVSKVLSSVLFIKLILLCFSFGILLLVLFFVPLFQDFAILHLLTFLFVLGHLLFPSFLFQGLERMPYITALNVFSKLFFLGGLLLFVKGPSDYLWVPIFFGCGFFSAAAFSWWIIIFRFQLRLMWPSWRFIIETVKESSEYFLSRVCVSFFTSSQVFFVGIFLGPVMAGFYAMAERIFLAMSSAVTPLISTLFPFMSREKQFPYYRYLFLGVVLLNVFISGLAFYFSDWITVLLFGHYVEVSARLIRIFSIVCVIQVPSAMIGYPLLAAFGFPEYANRSIMIAALVHVVGLVWVLPQKNIYYLAGLLIVTQGVVFLVRAFGVWKCFIRAR